ncbi:MAG: aromatic ring-hydroxylating dioxygenase subunit alpha [Pseudomonadota bacterium]|nr:aromatic ring-hydroxylating dioxygenase subunit alpha [Pseudomonadota bacterium]
MSDLSISLQALERSGAQLPVSSYFDPALFALEQQRIFAHAPRYVGHELAVPEIGDHLALPHEGEGRALVRTVGGVELISNVCRHRQAIMLKGRGSTGGGPIVCPLHRWTYDLHGQLVGAPHFDVDPCLHLRNYPLQQWHGLQFEAAAEPGDRHVATDLAALGAAADLDFSGFVWGGSHLHSCNYNWKTFIEVYLEDYHVGPFHPGLGGFVACDELQWAFGQHHSVQTVGLQPSLTKAGSAAYRRWQEAVVQYSAGRTPKAGAIWLTLYPTLMVEWYPHVLVVSTLVPQGPQQTLNRVEFFYPEEIVAFEPEFVAAQQAAYLETCVEDDEIALRMDAGRHALMQRGDDEAGPYQSPMEDGMQHFHEWYRRAIDRAQPPGHPPAPPTA